MPEERRRLLTFVIIGGGPTGVEMAGAVAELAGMALAADFRVINPKDARVVLVEGGPRILPTFPANLSERAQAAARAAGRRGPAGRAVTACDANGVVAAETRIESRTVDLGRRRDRLSGRKMARRRARPRGPDHGRTRPFSAGAPACVRDRRHGGGSQPAGARHRSCRQADGCLCRPPDRRASARRSDRATVPLSPPRQPRHHRPPGSRGRFRPDPTLRLPRLAASGPWRMSGS